LFVIGDGQGGSQALGPGPGEIGLSYGRTF
jgi:hypothetical protein